MIVCTKCSVVQRFFGPVMVSGGMRRLRRTSLPYPKSYYFTRFCYETSLLSPHENLRNLSTSASAVRDESTHDGHYLVDFLWHIVKSERLSRRGLHPKSTKDELGAMGTGAHGDTYFAERGSDLIGAVTVEDEGQHTGLVGCGAN